MIDWIIISIISAVLILSWQIFKKLKKSPPELNQDSNIESSQPIPEIDTVNQQTFEEEEIIDGDYDNEEELIAVLTAAIAAATKKSASGFRVTSFKKRGNW